MKNLLFRSVAFIASTAVAALVAIGNFVGRGIESIFNGLIFVIRSVSERILCAIDKDRYDHASLTIRQLPELNELTLLIAASKVKEDAVSMKMWTVAHTIAINKIGNALYSQCNWEPARIHKYLKSVIESIPGMVYSAGDDFETDGVV